MKKNLDKVAEIIRNGATQIRLERERQIMLDTVVQALVALDPGLDAKALRALIQPDFVVG